MVPHSWILECARMVGVAQSNQDLLGTVDIKRGIFQGDSLLPLRDHHVTTVTNYKAHKSWLPTQERRMQDQSPAIYG